LPWLASWVGVSQRDDWDETFKRWLISKIVPLYRNRVTKAGIKELLELYTGEEMEIYEAGGMGLRVGRNTLLGTTTNPGP
jgi:phage tail-like protein